MAPINEVTYNNVLATLVADQGVSTPINEVTCNSVALVIGVVGVNSKNK